MQHSEIEKGQACLWNRLFARPSSRTPQKGLVTHKGGAIGVTNSGAAPNPWEPNSVTAAKPLSASAKPLSCLLPAGFLGCHECWTPCSPASACSVPAIPRASAAVLFGPLGSWSLWGRPAALRKDSRAPETRSDTLAEGGRVCGPYSQFDGRRRRVSGGEEEGFQYYRRRIGEFSSRYEKVLLLGDSMGAPS